MSSCWKESDANFNESVIKIVIYYFLLSEKCATVWLNEHALLKKTATTASTPTYPLLSWWRVSRIEKCGEEKWCGVLMCWCKFLFECIHLIYTGLYYDISRVHHLSFVTCFLHDLDDLKRLPRQKPLLNLLMMCDVLMKQF